MTHDNECEQLPGGKYHGRTVTGTSVPIPCHCAARDDGRRKAARENAAAAVELSDDARIITVNGKSYVAHLPGPTGGVSYWSERNGTYFGPTRGADPKGKIGSVGRSIHDHMHYLAKVEADAARGTATTQVREMTFSRDAEILPGQTRYQAAKIDADGNRVSRWCGHFHETEAAAQQCPVDPPVEPNADSVCPDCGDTLAWCPKTPQFHDQRD